MSIEDVSPDPPLTAEQMRVVSRLSKSDLAEMDRVLLSRTDGRWRKTAFIVAGAMADIARLEGVPDVFFAGRVKRLVSDGRLEAKGDLNYMRFSEVRRAAEEVDAIES